MAKGDELPSVFGSLLASQSEHFEIKLHDLQQQLNRRIETQQREADDLKEFLEAKLDALQQQMDQRLATQLRESNTLRNQLQDHIDGQVAAIQIALVAQEKLGTEKDRRLSDIHAAAQLAISKAEESVERRLDLLNEFRGQAADQAENYLQREVFENTLAQWIEWRSKVDAQLIRSVSREDLVNEHNDRIQPWMIWAAGALLVAAVFIANVLTGGS